MVQIKDEELKNIVDDLVRVFSRISEVFDFRKETLGSSVDERLVNLIVNEVNDKKSVAYVSIITGYISAYIDCKYNESDNFLINTLIGLLTMVSTGKIEHTDAKKVIFKLLKSYFDERIIKTTELHYFK